MTCSFRAEVQPLIEQAIDTGDYLKLPSGSVLGIDVTSPLLQSFFPNDISFLEFEFMPMPAQVTPQMFFNVISGRGLCSAKKLPLLRCRLVKSGS